MQREKSNYDFSNKNTPMNNHNDSSIFNHQFKLNKPMENQNIHQNIVNTNYVNDYQKQTKMSRINNGKVFDTNISDVFTSINSNNNNNNNNNSNTDINENIDKENYNVNTEIGINYDHYIQEFNSVLNRKWKSDESININTKTDLIDSNSKRILSNVNLSNVLDTIYNTNNNYIDTDNIKPIIGADNKLILRLFVNENHIEIENNNNNNNNNTEINSKKKFFKKDNKSDNLSNNNINESGEVKIKEIKLNYESTEKDLAIKIKNGLNSKTKKESGSKKYNISLQFLLISKHKYNNNNKSNDINTKLLESSEIIKKLLNENNVRYTLNATNSMHKFIII